MIYQGSATVSDAIPRLFVTERAIARAYEIAAFDVAAVDRQVNAALGLTLPGAGRFVEARGVALIKLGPRRWLAVATKANADARLQSVSTLEGATVTDHNHGYTAFSLCGTTARDLLAKGTAVDLHPRLFRPGDVAVTAFAHMRVILRQQDTTPAYEIMVSRSNTRSLREWLAEACGALLNA
jgi:methylglutamate dehydrogenase subunit D